MPGSDTSSTTLAGTLFYLSHNPTPYQKARNEVRTIFQNASEIRMGAKLNSCTYLRACIDEALRMSPPVGGALWREVCSGGLTIGPHFFPAGVDLGVGIYSVHHNAEYFDAPFQYRPERWLVGANGSTKESVERAKSVFYPFSLGPRSCIGKGLAYHELTLTMAQILCQFEFSSADPNSSGIGRGEESVQEFRLRDHVTGAKSGPWLKFREAENS
jgi:cytochrome P450